MKQQQTNKHSNLHREDQHITVEELWRGWKTSEGAAPHPDSLCPPPPPADLVVTFLSLLLPSPSSPQLDHGGHGAVAERLGGAAAV